MSKIIIYDDKNFLIAELDGKVEKEVISDKKKFNYIIKNKYIATFSSYKLIHSYTLRKQLKKIEKIFKFHKEKKSGRE